MNSRLRHLRLPLAAVCLVASLAPSAAKEAPLWPGWLGPERNGIVSHFDPPTQWPKELNRLWSQELGQGYASTLVAGDKLYHHARQGDDEVVWCLDLKTGKPHWRKSYMVAFTPGGGGQAHGKGPKSSPALSEGRLFTLSVTGVLSAWDAESGDLLWREDFKDRYRKNQPYWGVSTSPVVDGPRVIVQTGDDESGALVALDVTTGKEVWSYDEDPTSYSSPIVADLGGVRQVIEWNQQALIGVESATGKLLWRYDFAQQRNKQNTATPLIHKDYLVLGGEDRGLRSVQPQLDADGQWTVTERWRQEDVAFDMSTPVIVDDLVFGFSHYRRGQFFCLDPEDGKVLWKGDGRAGENVAFLGIQDHVIALIDRAELQVLRPSREGFESVATYEVADAPTWSPPILLQDAILIKDVENLHLFSFR
jgi:outer membrane protein assembly factor BamB